MEMLALIHQNLIIMDLPFEVIVIILSYLKIKDLIEVSSVCKTYYLAVRQNKFFRRKLLDSKTLFNNERFVFDYYYDSCVCFSYDLC